MKFKNLIAKLTNRETKYMLVNSLPNGIERQYSEIEIRPENKAKELNEYIFLGRFALVDQKLRTFDEAISDRKKYLAEHPSSIEGDTYKTC
jgi:hypothetical protein